MNILLIDLSSICHAIYHIETANPDPNATSTKTVERVRALASGQPHVGVCIEGGRSFRKDIDPTYKQNRPESDAALQHQIALAIDILRADGFPILQAKGFEADDMIAASVNRLIGPPDVEITIASADKDLLALIGPGVTVKSLKDGSLIDAAAVEAKFGVRPDQMLDFLALVGDASDNIKGAKGIGTVTAAKLLKEHGSIEGILAKKEQQTIAMRAALEDFAPRLNTVRSLLRLRTDAPIDVEPLLKERIPLDVAEFGAEEMTDENMGRSGGSGSDERDSAGSDRRSESRPDAGGSAPDRVAVSDRVESVDSRQDSGILDSSGRRDAGLARVNGTHTDDPAPIEFERQLEPRNMAQMKALAADLFASRLCSAYGHPAGVMSTILAGRELGLPAMASLRAFHIIENKPCLAADFIRALVLRSGVVEYFRCTERTPERATFVAKRKGDPEISLTFTIEDARRAWSKKPEAWELSGWGRNPADMCVARAGAKLARLVAPDVVSGLYAPEEFE